MSAASNLNSIEADPDRVAAEIEAAVEQKVLVTSGLQLTVAHDAGSSTADVDSVYTVTIAAPA